MCIRDRTQPLELPDSFTTTQANIEIKGFTVFGTFLSAVPQKDCWWIFVCKDPKFHHSGLTHKKDKCIENCYAQACRMINELLWHSSMKNRQVTPEDKSVYLCQKSVITMKNQVWPISSPKEKIRLQPKRLQRYRRLPLEHAKLRQIFENKSEGVLFPK